MVSARPREKWDDDDQELDDVTSLSEVEVQTTLLIIFIISIHCLLFGFSSFSFSFTLSILLRYDINFFASYGGEAI